MQKNKCITAGETGTRNAVVASNIFNFSTFDNFMSEQNWESVLCEPVNVHGATSARVEDVVYLLGGVPEGPKTRQYLSVYSFNEVAAELTESAVNTCGVPNRAYHSAVQFADHTLLVGGELSDGSLAADVVRCSVGDEGFSSKVLHQDGVPRVGMVGAVVGPSGGEVGVIFGGFDGLNYHNDVTLIQFHTEGECEFKLVPLEGEKPQPRAFSAFSVYGANNEFIVVSGGYNGTDVFDDIWILDVSKSIPCLKSDTEATAPAKGGKGNKGAAPEEPLKWTKVAVSLPEGRFKHSCYSYKQGDRYAFRILGGMNRTGILSATPIEFMLGPDGSPGNHTDCEAIAQEDSFLPRYGGIVVPVTGDGQLYGVFLFGGVTDGPSPEIGFGCISEDSTFTIQLRNIFEKRRREKKPVEAAASREENGTDHNQTEVIEFPNGDRYEGEVARVTSSDANTVPVLVPNGVGTMTYVDSSCYEGAWELGVKSGSGRFKDADGNTFNGLFSDNCFNGLGIYRIAVSGEEFEGSFLNNSLEGIGVWRDTLGNVYEGEFMRNVKHGHGMLYSTGEVNDDGKCVLYSGQWVDGKPCGRGTLQLMVEGEGTGGLMIPAKYEGEILEGLPYGRGECFYSDGSHYSGQWRRRLRNGFGMYTSSTGDEYDGKWVADKRCGKGSWKSFRGDRYVGMWESDVPHGTGEYSYASGSVFSGDWVHGKCHGRGKMIYSDSSEYSGQWEHGYWHGTGDWSGPARSDGEISYSGEWSSGQRNGQGTATYSSGDKYTGRFQNDRPNTER